MLALLFYGYATGVFSSRKLEQATYDSVAFRYLAGNTHPDHDTIAHFRKRFLEELKPLFVEILLLAQAMGFLKLGRVSLDGTNFQAQCVELGAHPETGSAAARRSGHAAGRGSGWTRRNGRDGHPGRAGAAGSTVESDSSEAEAGRAGGRAAGGRHAEYEGKVAKRQAQRKRGNKPKGREPKPPRGGIRDQDQINLTDEDSRIMPVSGGGFEQCSQALVDNDSLLIVAVHVTPNANLKPALARIAGVVGSAPAAGRQRLLHGANVELCSEHAVLPYIAVEREAHHLPPNDAGKNRSHPGKTPMRWSR